MILQVALDTPLRRVFDYLPPTGGSQAPQPGVRVQVPFGRRKLIGIVTAIAAHSSVPAPRLRTVIKVLDAQPVFDPVTFELLRWAADYYHHPVGEVYAAGLPHSLRIGQAAFATTEYWSVTAQGRAQLERPGDQRAPQQRALLAWLAAHEGSTASDIGAHWRAPRLKLLRDRGWICAAAAGGAPAPRAARQAAAADLTLTAAQTEAVAAILDSLSRFAAHLLHGVTGSGKTEVYLRAIAAAIAAGGQALVLVPEIALTPQLVERFRRRFAGGVVALHSALTDTERRDAWRAAHSGGAGIVIGTRSAVFTSMPKLALIVVDEEHDGSYKQQEGFRYSARDLAVMRARGANVPVVMGSATPSLETIENAMAGRYLKHLLPHRPGAAQAPRMALVDLRRHPSQQGLSTPAVQAIDAHLRAGGQVIVFLNRRGYAPSLFCNSCGWVAPCAHCDARMTLHRRARQLRCHHCGAHAAIPDVCGSCGQALLAVGQGTERVEDALAQQFPDVPLARLDRDTAGGHGAMRSVLERVHSGAARILVGTQMLTKGHHFAAVTLVVILDADQGLFASDFRATERLAQTIIQVAGRAGREATPGAVLIQTAFPEHPLLIRLATEGYDSFATSALQERRDANWPPYSRLAMFRAEAKNAAVLDGFLNAAARAGAALEEAGVKILGPASALMARRADYLRAHLLLEADARAALQRFLTRWLPRVEGLPAPASLRWSIDVDPLQVD